MYLAWICYPQAFEDDEDDYEPEATIEFSEPSSWKYGRVIPISFSVLHSWTDKDKELYK
jgi:hypothetical protein